MLPRMRRKAELRKRERELDNRRQAAAEEQRAEATARERQAAEAEQRARIAAREAEAERAQAELHQERAGLHERGMADHELIDESERDRFAGTSAMSPDRDRDGVDDRRERGTLDDDRPVGERPARFNRDEVAERDRRDAPTRY
jgi:hypothetical protein